MHSTRHTAIITTTLCFLFIAFAAPTPNDTKDIQQRAANSNQGNNNQGHYLHGGARAGVIIAGCFAAVLTALCIRCAMRVDWQK